MASKGLNVKNENLETRERLKKPEEPKKSKGFFSGFKRLFAKEVVVPPPAAVFSEIPENAEVVDTYPINPPFAMVTIASLPELGGGKAYFIEEVQLSPEEKLVFHRLADIMSVEVEPPEDDNVDPKVYVENEARRLALKYGVGKKLSEESWFKIFYYLKRDLVGFGCIDVVMNDRMIEDVSVNGVALPVYIWHRQYESMPTNLKIVDEATLDNILIKLTHMAQKHISTAFPILDAMLPGKDRIAATFRKEVSPKGSSFCIRRFREEPFSIIDLIELGTLDEMLAAYFWIILENRMTLAVIGGTGAGKTSTLNALASLIKPSMKIVTVEEIPELLLPHDNWVQLVSRESYGLGESKTGGIGLFDLVRVSLRYRPDYIVVGEIRGEEAFVLFQAMATGHGGLTTLHAETLDHAVKRLTSPPMNIAEAYIPLINVAVLQERVQLPRVVKGLSFGRRIMGVYEVLNYEKYSKVANWNIVGDNFQWSFGESEILERIAQKLGVTREAVLKEISKRALFFRNLRLRNVRSNSAVRKEMVQYQLLNPFPAPAMRVARGKAAR